MCDRNCDKIHILAANIACCGAGTSADAVRTTEVGFVVVGWLTNQFDTFVVTVADVAAAVVVSASKARSCGVAVCISYVTNNHVTRREWTLSPSPAFFLVML